MTTAQHPARRPSPPGGFTLIEVLVAVTLSAVLLIGTATLTGMFSESVAALTEDVASEHEAALARIARDVRYAWWTEVPSTDRLIVSSHEAELTEYHLDGSDLLVSRPGGESGTLCEHVTSLAFTPRTQQRLREGPLVSMSGELFARSAPPTVTQSLELPTGSRTALALLFDSDAATASVADVPDKIADITPTTLYLPLANAGLGGQLQLDVFRARAPRDPRPRPGATALGTLLLPLAALPPATVDPTWIDDGTISPPSATIEVSAQFEPPAGNVPIDVAGMLPPLEPGVAYSILLTVTGANAKAVMSGSPNLGAGGNLAYAATPGDALTRSDLVVAYSTSGNAAATTTVLSAAVSMVRTTMVASSGESWIRSASVYSQVMAEDPWLGVVPGEAAPQH